MLPNQDKTLDEFVERILRRQTGFKGQLSATTELYYDLSLAGDDTCEVLEALTRQFGTSWDGMQFERYFPDEATALFNQIAKWLGYRRKNSFTIGHLLNVIRSGRWFEPPT
jgi:hypothetical protein